MAPPKTGPGPRLRAVIVAGALAGPVAGAAATTMLSARAVSPVVVFGTLGTLAVVAIGCFVALARRRRPVALAALALLTAWAALVQSHRASPLEASASPVGAWPKATPPSAMSVHRLPTGLIHRTAAFAYRGGSLLDARDMVMTSVLVEHPSGDVLIDTGLGRKIDDQFGELPFYVRVATRYEKLASAADQLEAAHYDATRLRAILLTHAHWDHVSGAPDFPSTPIWVPPEEHRFAREGGPIMAFARLVPDERYEEYAFDSGPYLGFTRSHDVYGDGAIVVVPAPGHTPGSVIVFLSLPSGQRYALVGDLVWQLEGLTEREERPWVQRTLADRDAPRNAEGIRQMSALAERVPDLIVVPAHDGRGFASMPLLGPAGEASRR